MSDNFKPNIWRLQSQINTQGLIEALKSDDAGIRRGAAAALRALGAFNAIPDLEDALQTESDPETRSNIVAALEALQSEKERQEKGAVSQNEPSAILSETERLIEKLQQEKDPDVIMQTARTLGTLGDKLAVAVLMKRFTDPTVPIKARLVVAEALLKLESAPVEVTLLGALRSEDWRVRRNGAAILGQLKAVWAVEPLAEALYDENEHVRKTAFAALRHIGTDEAKKALLVVRDDIRRKRAQSVTQTGENPVANNNDLVWPTSNRKNNLNDDNPNLAPTKPLDPRTLDALKKKPEDHSDAE